MKDRALLRLSFPNWFLVFFAVVSSIAVIAIGTLFISALIHFAQLGFTIPRLIISAVLLVIPAGYLLMIRCIYLWITATESGLHATGLLHPRRRFTWNEIITVSRPLLTIPKDAVYVYSKTRSKIMLSRSMDGYPELLELIQSRAPNLSPKTLPPELWAQQSRKEWKYVLIFFGIFIVYVIARLIFKF